ncbi:catalase family protein [Pedobacter sp. SG908]|uniref:catalase family protein n=1 Tax=Pedobacter sp. SG908 TaxID=2587135 RepID=UPI001421E76C|nr:catalase family protein [Pedobacter sp. SG908]NII81058.1 catalase [Pedobacter sp. SG908]
MKREYILFSQEAEDLPKDFEQHTAAINADVKAFVERSPSVSNTNYHTRDAHAKGYAALKAEFTIFDNLPEELAQGIYAHPGKHEAVIRLSNGAARASMDRFSGNAQGMAIKVLNVPGKKLAPGEEDTLNVDFNLINHPVFFCNSSHDYMFIDKLFHRLHEYFGKGAWGKIELAYLWTTEMGKAFPSRNTLKELKALLSFQDIKPQNTFLYNFYSMGAVRHGKYIAKLRVRPCEESVKKVDQIDVDVDKDDEAYRKSILETIRKQDFKFEFQVQLCQDLKKMPVNDLTVEWPQELSPFQTVAELYIPRQEVNDDGNFEIMEHLSFTPFRCLEANRPMGDLQMARLKAYQISSETRHRLNGKEREEPKTLKELFG